MMQEQYVSFETAKFLREKRFYQSLFGNDWPVWRLNGNRPELTFVGEDNYPCEWEEWYSAPSQAVAMRWLREEHQIAIVIDIWFGNPNYLNWYGKIMCFGDNLKMQQDINSPSKETYEDAAEAAIKYCLENLI